jgi:hypothetical protein
VAGKGLERGGPPPEAGEQREVWPAVEGQGSLTPAPAPPHQVASFLMQPAILGGRHLAGRARDQRGKVLAGEPTILNAPTLGPCIELRSVGEVSGHRVEEPKQAEWRVVVDARPSLCGNHAALASQITPITG